MLKRILAQIRLIVKAPQDIIELRNINNATDSHLIALCRLMFIKPEQLYREVNNARANNDYIQKLIAVRDEKTSTPKKNKN